LKALKGEKVVSEQALPLRESEDVESEWTFHLSNANQFHQVKLTYYKLDGSNTSYVFADWVSEDAVYDVAYELYLAILQKEGKPLFSYEEIQQELDLL
jgi:hypothetical protein